METLKEIFNNAVSYNVGVNVGANDVRSCINVITNVGCREAGSEECGVIYVIGGIVGSTVLVGVAYLILDTCVCSCLRVNGRVLNVVDYLYFIVACVSVVNSKQYLYNFVIGNVLCQDLNRKLGRIFSRSRKTKSNGQNGNSYCQNQNSE